MSPHDRYLDRNRATWDAWAALHESSRFYDVDGFRRGKSSLKPIEREEVGDVSGRSLLHLQCHFGLDTLSWARLGAKVTGIDFSGHAIERARVLASEAGIEARFICADVRETEKHVSDPFDIVFTSWGVIPWLPELDVWANAIASRLATTGYFYMVEFHPFLATLDDAGSPLAYPYFHDPAPLEVMEAGTYAVPDNPDTHTHYCWQHTMGDVISALARSGLRIEFVHEFPYSPHGCFPFLTESSPGRYTLSGHESRAPLVFSLKATK